MSKKLIAGAGVVASFAIALAPLATFADNSATYDQMKQRDTLKVTIEEICAFGHNYEGSNADIEAGTHTNGANSEHGTITGAGVGAGMWNNSHVSGDSTVDVVEPATAPASTDILYGVMENNKLQENFGKTTLNIVCTGTDGYQLKAVGTNLVSSDAKISSNITHQATVATSKSAWGFKIAATESKTNIGTVGSSYSTEGWKAVASQDVIASAAAATTNNGGYDSWTITYGVSIDSQQPAGTYEGTMTYTLVDLPTV